MIFLICYTVLSTQLVDMINGRLLSGKQYCITNLLNCCIAYYSSIEV